MSSLFISNYIFLRASIIPETTCVLKTISPRFHVFSTESIIIGKGSERIHKHLHFNFVGNTKAGLSNTNN
jgi:hypothetical protein